jgi:outer membrane protein OmpA-like peptidoglycan-associated protein
MAGMGDIARLGSVCIVLAAGATGLTPPAFAQQPSEAQILEALKPKGSTRSLALTPEEQRKIDDDRKFIDEIRSRQKSRSLSSRDRDTVAKIGSDKPNVDIEIQFEYNSAVLTPQGRQYLQTVGRVMSGDQLKGSVFFINGHTDAKGGEDYNQGLSQRRAETVKKVLMEDYRLPADTLVAVGHGKNQLKNTADPLAGENRRVQIVNTEQQAASR